MAYIKKDEKTAKSSMDYRSLIKQEAFRLAEMLSQSPEYCQFLQARARLEADDEQTLLLSELRQQQIAISMAAMAGEEPDEDEMSDFNELYSTLADNATVSDYLFAEGRLLHLISDVEDVFSNKLELWQPQPPDEPAERSASLLN